MDLDEIFAADPEERGRQTGEESSASDTEDSSLSEEDGMVLSELQEEEGEEEDVEGFQQPRTKNEITETPAEFLQVPDYVEKDVHLSRLGVVFACVDRQVVVQSTAKHQALDLENLLVLESRQVLGKIFDTFGPVDDPFYTVVCKEDVGPVQVGLSVYFIPDSSKPVSVQQLLLAKGCDASNMFDEEINESEMEFSADELEGGKKSVKRRNRARPGNEGTRIDYGIGDAPLTSLGKSKQNFPNSTASDDATHSREEEVDRRNNTCYNDSVGPGHGLSLINSNSEANNDAGDDLTFNPFDYVPLTRPEEMPEEMVENLPPLKNTSLGRGRTRVLKAKAKAEVLTNESSFYHPPSMSQ